MKETPFLRHDAVGAQILANDPELSSVLGRAGISPKKISDIFTRQTISRFVNLVSSDLDADRIDYLLRTAHHSGLPYGAVDLEYILSQMRTDRTGNICLTPKALRAADHFLLCRYFDYQQLTYHKTVVAFELVLNDLIEALLGKGRLDCSPRKITEMIRMENWKSFDDFCFIHLIRDIDAGLEKSDPLKWKTRSILARKPASLIVDVERLDEREKGDQMFSMLKSHVESWRRSWAAAEGIDDALWFSWSEPMALTKVGSRVPISPNVTDRQDVDEYEQAIRILSQDGTSKPIMGCPSSLMNVLSNYALYTVRLYALIPEDDEGKKNRLRKRLKDLSEKELARVGIPASR